MPFNAGAIIGKAKIDNSQWGTGLKAMKKGLTVLGVGVGAVTVLMTKATVKANAFQKSMSNVATVIDTGAISTQEMTKELLKLDPALGKTIDLTDALYQTFSAGAETMEEALTTTEAAAKFSKAALTDVATAVDVLTTASNAYGKEVVSTTQASDVFFTTIKRGKITGEQLASSIGQSIPLYASTGIEIEQLASGMAAMTKQGISANESTTQLNAIINSVLKPTESLSAAIGEYGFESSAAFLESEGLTGVLKLMEEQTGGNADKISELIPNIRAMKGVMALTGVGGKEYAATLEEMAFAAGATDEAFAKQEMTFETLSASLDKIEIVAGNVGKHFVDKIAVGAITAGKGVMDFILSSRGMEIVAQVAETTAGGFEFLRSVGMLLIDNVLPPLKTLWDSLTTTIGKMSGEVEAGAGATKLLVGAIELLSAGFSIVAQVASATITTIGDLAVAVTTSASAVGSFFDMLTGKVKFSEVKDNFKDVGDAFLNLGKGVVDGWGGIITTALDEFTGFTSSVEEGSLEITTNIKTTQDATRNYVISNWDAMLTGQTDFVDKYKEGQNEIETSTEETTDSTSEENMGLIEQLKSAWNGYFEEAAFSWKGLMESVTSALDFGLDAASKISSQYFENEFAKLTNWKFAQLDAISATYDARIAALQVLTEEEQALKDFQRQQEIDALMASTEEEDILKLAAMLAEEERIKQLTLAEEQAANERAAIEEQALAKQNELSKQQFETQKALDTASVWMDAASSISGWWANAPKLGPIAGPIFAGVMTGASLGMAAKQTSLISKQEFVPAREMGGMAGGMTRINEAGGEIVSLPDGSQVIPNDISRQIAGDSSSQIPSNIINVSFAGAQIDNKMNLRKVAKDVSKILGKELRKAV